jgi:hypothetical protein
MSPSMAMELPTRGIARREANVLNWPQIRRMQTMANPAHKLDAAMTLTFHIRSQGLGATHRG